MPVWHALTQELRAKGELEVVGIVQEQHAERAELYAAWQGLDFPILWDPFNTTGVRAVLIASLVDEHGVVRATGLRARDSEGFAALLAREFEAPGDAADGGAAPEPWVTPMHGRVRRAHPPGSIDEARAAVSRALFSPDAPPAPGALRSGAFLDGVVDALERRAAAPDAAPADRFRAGVARRLRFDSLAAKPGDLQASIDHWVAALAGDPNQYIWRRRIQQWGPLLDKPYPFYDWVEKALSDLAERGTPHAPLAVGLTGSEALGKTRALPRLAESELAPDPERRITVDPGELVRVETASAPSSRIADPHASLPVGTARVHVSLGTRSGVHWAPDADPPLVWVVVPQGWSIERNLHVFRLPRAAEGDDPSGPTTIDFEIAAPASARTAQLLGYALYSVCGEDDVCVMRRQDFRVRVDVRGTPPEKEDE